MPRYKIKLHYWAAGVLINSLYNIASPEGAIINKDSSA